MGAEAAAGDRARKLALDLAEIKREQSRRSLIRFARHVAPAYQVTPVHEAIATALDEVLAGRIPRLIICVPPQIGKSELASRLWPAYALGRCPDLRIIGTSYNCDLASMNSRRVRRYMRSPAYRELFDAGAREARAKGEFADLADYFEVPGAEGYYLGTGLRSSMTGYGFDLGIIDDPIKDRAEAFSETIREQIEGAYESVFKTRQTGLGPDGLPSRMVIIMTRWHPHDLVGHVLEHEPDDWRVLWLPAIAEAPPVELVELGVLLDGYEWRREGESIWPARKPATWLAKLKATTPAGTWASLWQQWPEPEGGRLFKRAWWGTYDAAPVYFDEVWQSWDLTFHDEGTSRVAGLVMGRVRKRVYVLDLMVGQWDYPETRAAMRTMSERWPLAYAKIVEHKANGPAIRSELGAELGGIIPWPPKGVAQSSKIERASATLPACMAGDVLLPRFAPWLDEFLSELGKFPGGKHDDIVDAFAQGMAYGVLPHRPNETDVLDALTECPI